MTFTYNDVTRKCTAQKNVDDHKMNACASKYCLQDDKTDVL